MTNKRVLVGVLLVGVWLCVLSCAIPGESQAAQSTKPADLDNDGKKESNIYVEDGKIVKVAMDKNHDGKTDATMYYRDGFRDNAEIDANFDGIIDTVILYYFTGIPASVAIDRNGDSKPDSWTYFKNGFVYRREWDRNLDGIPDYRMLFSTKADYRADKSFDMQKIEKQYDNNFDGVFEKKVKTTKRSKPKRLTNTPASLSLI